MEVVYLKQSLRTAANASLAIKEALVENVVCKHAHGISIHNVISISVFLVFAQNRRDVISSKKFFSTLTQHLATFLKIFAP